MPQYIGVNNVVKTVSDMVVGVDNVVRTVDKKYAGVDNVLKIVYDKRSYDVTFTVSSSNYLSVGTVFEVADEIKISGSDAATRNARYTTDFPLCSGDVITGEVVLQRESAGTETGQAYSMTVDVLNSNSGTSNLQTISLTLTEDSKIGNVNVTVPSNHHNKNLTIRLMAEGDTYNYGTLSFTLYVNGKKIT